MRARTFGKKPFWRAHITPLRRKCVLTLLGENGGVLAKNSRHMSPHTIRNDGPHKIQNESPHKIRNEGQHFVFSTNTLC